MKKSELAFIIHDNKFGLEVNGKLKSFYEEQPMVKSYLDTIAEIEYGEKYQEFLSKLVIGEDETVFAPYYDDPNKSCSRNHFGLSDVLEYALFLVRDYNYRELGIVSVYTKLSFDSFQKYLDNAILVLNDMRYYDGDRLIDNDYGIEVYDNPENYSVVNFKELMPLDDKQFRRSYNLDSIMVENNSFVTLSKIFLSDSQLKELTPREREAFFGDEEKKALGVLPEKQNVRKKEAKHFI